MRARYSLIISLFAILLSVVALCVASSRNDIPVDYLSTIVGILSTLVTILIGWNIYTVIDFRQERVVLKQYFDDQKESVHSVGGDLLVAFKNQLSNNSLLEKDIADVYVRLMGLKNDVPLSFEYLYHVLGAIVTASQAENYDACNVWIKEIKQVLTYPEHVVVSESNKQQLIKALMQMSHTDRLSDLDDVISLVARIKTSPVPVP